MRWVPHHLPAATLPSPAGVLGPARPQTKRGGPARSCVVGTGRHVGRDAARELCWGDGGRLVLWGSSLSLGLTPQPSQTLLPAPVVLPSVHELDLFR